MNKRKLKYINGQQTNSMLPDHAAMLKRKSHWTRSDILHASPDKAIQMINSILSGQGTLS